MKLVTKQSLAFRTTGIQLNKAETETMRKASAIAERARELARTIHEDFESEDQDLWLAEIEHNCAALAVDGFLPIKEEIQGRAP